MESTISWPKMIRLPQNKKPTYWLNSMPQMWPSGLTFTMTLNLNFQGQIWNLLYLSQRWFDCHKIKSMHIEIWSEGLNDHQVWPWPWPWKVRCKDLPDSDRGDFRCGHAIDLSSSCGKQGCPLSFHTKYHPSLGAFPYKDSVLPV